MIAYSCKCSFINRGGEYSYYAKTNRLEKVADGMGGVFADKRKMDDAGNFVYDSEGF